MKNNGTTVFEDWLTWDGTRLTLHQTPRATKGGGVYVIEAESCSFARVNHTSPIAYIGRSDDLAKRLMQLKTGAHHVLRRLERLLCKAESWQATPEAQRRYRVTAFPCDAPALEEARRLAEYASKHAEFPPANRSGTTEVSALALVVLMEKLRAVAALGHGMGTGSLRVHGPFDDDKEGHTYVTLSDRKRDFAWLIWTRPQPLGSAAAKRPVDWPTTRQVQAEHAYLYLLPNVLGGHHPAIRARPREKEARGASGWLLLGPALPLSVEALEREEGLLRAVLDRTPNKPEGVKDNVLGALRDAWAGMCAKAGE